MTKLRVFYIPSSNKDAGADLTMNNVVVIHKTNQGYNQEIKLMGCQFNIDIKKNVRYWISKI